ncbi:MAG: GNAT family N-acetyltransferase [Vulcanimicrobiaceae bacterium]
MSTAEEIADRFQCLIEDVEVQHGRRPSDRARGGWHKLLFGRIGEAEIELCTYGDGTVELNTIAVAPHKRRQGHARAAMAAILRLADELGIALTLCPTSLDSRLGEDVIKAWYVRNGFVPIFEDRWRRPPLAIDLQR